MKEKCDSCGRMEDMQHFFERRYSSINYRYKLCWDCGEAIREIIDAGKGEENGEL
jgi:hypothetical protein